MVFIAAPLSYYFAAKNREKILIKQRAKANSVPNKTNEEIADELFRDGLSKEAIKKGCLTKKSTENAIREELQKRNFDFEKAEIELVFEKKEWIRYKVKDHEYGSDIF